MLNLNSKIFVMVLTDEKLFIEIIYTIGWQLLGR